MRGFSLIAIVMSVCAWHEAHATEQLRYRWKTGDEYRIQESQVVEQLQRDAAGGSVTVKHETWQGIRWKVGATAPDGSADVEFMIEYQASRDSVGGNVVATDTRNPNDPSPALIGVRMVIGKAIRIHITNRGEVTAVPGIEKLGDEIRDKLEEIKLPKEARPIVDTFLQSAFSEDGARTIVKRIVPVLPEASVTKGGTWTMTAKSNGGVGDQTDKVDYVVTSDIDVNRPIEISANTTSSVKSNLEAVDVDVVKAIRNEQWTLAPGTRFPTQSRLNGEMVARYFAKQGGERKQVGEMTIRMSVRETTGSEMPPIVKSPAPPPQEAEASPLLAIAFTPDGGHVVSGDQHGAVKVWDLAGQGSKQVIGTHAAPVLAVRMSADASQIWAASADGALRLWNSRTHQAARSVETGGRVFACGFDADGKRAVVAHPAAGSTSSVELWDLGSGRKIRDVATLPASPRSLALSDDGKRMAAAGVDPSGKPYVVLVNPDTGTDLLPKTIDRSSLIPLISLNGDGQFMLIGRLSQGITLEVWNVNTGTRIHNATGLPLAQFPAATLTGGEKGRAAILLGHDTFIFDFATNAFGRVPDKEESRIVILSPDGKTIARASGNMLWFNHLER